MNYLKTNLNIYEFNDSEKFFVVAENLDSAIQYYKNEIICDNEVNMKEVIINLVSVDSKEMIRINDDERLWDTVNHYKGEINAVNAVNIWQMLKWELIKYDLQGIKLDIPFCLVQYIKFSSLNG